MSDKNAMTVFGGGVMATKDLTSMAEKAAAAALNDPRQGSAPDGSEFLNFSGKKGVYTVGTGDKARTIQDDEYWLVNVASFEEGFICWKGSKPISTRLANIYTGVPVAAPDPEELGPFVKDGEGWHQAKAMVLKSLDNETQGYFKINSVSGVSAFAELMGKFSERAAAGEPAWPIITLGAEEFTAQGYSNSKPVLDVVAWISDEDIRNAGDDISALLDHVPEAAPAEPTPPARRPRRPRRARA